MGSMSSSGSSGGMCAWCGGGTGEGGSSSSHMLLIQFCFRRGKNGEETVSRTAYHLPHQLLHFLFTCKKYNYCKRTMYNLLFMDPTLH